MFNTAVADALLWTIGVSRYSDERKELNTTQCESENIDQEGNSGGKQPSGEISESNLIEGEGSPGLIELRADCSEANESNQSMSSLSSYQGLCLNNSKKRLSWSDTLGKNLVQYDDESCERHNPPRPGEIQSTRSAISRSRSIPNRLVTQDEHRYLPKGLSKPRENIGLSKDSGEKSGLESPQWGWYIRTTPPSPEMYYSSEPTHRKHSSSSNASAYTEGSCPQPNPVFQGLQAKDNVPMAWPSVPL